MKILLVNTYYHPIKVGGAEISVQNLAEELVNKGHDVVAVTLGRENGNDNINGVKVCRLPIKNLYLPVLEDPGLLYKSIWHLIDSYNPFYKGSFKSFLKDETPDIIHTHNLAGFSVNIWNTIKSLGFPLLHTIRDYYLLCAKNTLFRNGKRCQKRCPDCKCLSFPRVRSTHKPDAVTGISNFVLEKHLEEGCFKKTVNRKVIYNPIKTNVSCDNLQSSSENIKLGYLGRIEETKGIRIVLEGLQKWSGDFKLLIAGKGEASYVESLKERFESEKVEFIGYVNPKQLFSQIDYLVVPSLWNEPFGRVVVEAFSYGIPVIGSKRGGITELIEDRKTGWLFDPTSQRSFLNVLRTLAKLPTEKYKLMSRSCSEKSKEFSSEKIANDYLTLYNRLLSSKF